jgi:hypothetical protein
MSQYETRLLWYQKTDNNYKFHSPFPQFPFWVICYKLHGTSMKRWIFWSAFYTVSWSVNFSRECPDFTVHLEHPFSNICVVNLNDLSVWLSVCRTQSYLAQLQTNNMLHQNSSIKHEIPKSLVPNYNNWNISAKETTHIIVMHSYPHLLSTWNIWTYLCLVNKFLYATSFILWGRGVMFKLLFVLLLRALMLIKHNVLSWLHSTFSSTCDLLCDLLHNLLTGIHAMHTVSGHSLGLAVDWSFTK